MTEILLSTKLGVVKLFSTCFIGYTMGLTLMNWNQSYPVAMAILLISDHYYNKNLETVYIRLFLLLYIVLLIIFFLVLIFYDAILFHLSLVILSIYMLRPLIVDTQLIDSQVSKEYTINNLFLISLMFLTHGTNFDLFVNKFTELVLYYIVAFGFLVSTSYKIFKDTK